MADKKYKDVGPDEEIEVDSTGNIVLGAVKRKKERGTESIESLKERMMPSPKPTPSPKFEDGMKKKLTEKLAEADDPRPVNTAPPKDIGGNAAYQKKLKEWKARTGKE